MKHIFSNIVRLLVVCVASFVCSAASYAANISMIRDAETETVIARVIEPLLSAAGYHPSDISIYLVNDNRINAYVAGGKNIFLHTGLLTFSPDVSVVAGVLAHEIGHITGSHIIRRNETAGDFTLASAAGLILGLGAGAVAGPGAGTAVFGAAQHALTRGFLSETRKQEESADFTAIDLMQKTGYNPRGLESLLSHLHVQEVSGERAVDPYARTHPLSGDRLQYIRNAADDSTAAGASVQLREDYRFVYAKLNGFLGRPEYVLERYSPGVRNREVSEDEAAYAAAIAYYRKADMPQSFALLDALRHKNPDNPFFDELKAQFLFETGKVSESAELYYSALTALPDNMLLRAQYASVLLTKQQPSEQEVRRALTLLEHARNRGERTLYVLRMLGIAHAKAGNIGLSNLSLAEWAIASRNKKQALTFLTLARPHISAGTPADLRLRDAEDAADAIEKKK